MKRLFRIVCLLAPCIALAGCAAAVIGGAAAGAGAAHDRRSFGSVIDDNAIELGAYDNLNKDKELALRNNVEIVSYNGTVLLMGEVRTAELKSRAEDRVREIEGVRRVVNELQVRELTSVVSSTRDKWITGRAKLALLDIVDVPRFDPSRVNVTTQAGVVYLMGLVTHPEADRIVAIVRDVPGVARVVKVFEYTD
ncbi:MAG TPA: BON domain-containing protein [Candidatus Saccharimonadia bacterium]|nr:BON domain-containing protein [Candidatus Saccharimonadia bacterium]